MLFDYRQFRVRFLLLAAVEDNVDVHAAFLGLDERLGNRLGREGIGEHEDFTAGALDLGNHGVRAAALGEKKTETEKRRPNLRLSARQQKSNVQAPVNPVARST